MTDDAIDALERVARILAAGSSPLDILREANPEYVRGAGFVYKNVAEVIQSEIDYIKKHRAFGLTD